MFTNIGKKIKTLAQCIFWIIAIGVAVVGLIFVGESSNALFLLLTLIGILIAWISSWFLYGFGEIIDKLCDIERNTRSKRSLHDAPTQSQTYTPATREETPDERRNRIEKMRSLGLITDEEYRQAMEKVQ